jgi:carbonic anhydrase/acetyltransferase-like protein (isoleucine patch superfamily)
LPVYALGDRVPRIDPAAFVHPDAVIIGDVRIGPESTVWPAAVLRGDHGSIVVGARTSIQDGTVVHCTGAHDTTIGDRCVVGHNAHLEGCTVEDDCLIGMGATVLNGAVIGAGSLVAAGAVVLEGTIVPPRSLVAGVPAKVRRELSDDEIAGLTANAAHYVELSRQHAAI